MEEALQRLITTVAEAMVAARTIADKAQRECVIAELKKAGHAAVYAKQAWRGVAVAVVHEPGEAA